MFSTIILIGSKAMFNLETFYSEIQYPVFRGTITESQEIGLTELLSCRDDWTPAELATLAAVNESFRVAMPTPEAAIQEMAKVTEDLATLFDKLNTRLREKTDDLVKAYEEMQREFVRGYLGARKMV